MDKNKLFIGLGGIGTNQLKKSILYTLNDTHRPEFLIVDCSDIKDIPNNDYYVDCKEKNVEF